MSENSIEHITESTEELRLNKNLKVPSREGLRPEVKIGGDVPQKIEAKDPSVPEGSRPADLLEMGFRSGEDVKKLMDKSKGLDLPAESDAPHRNRFRKFLREETPQMNKDHESSSDN